MRHGSVGTIGLEGGGLRPHPGWGCARRRAAAGPSGEVLPPAQLMRVAAQEELHTLAALDAADDRERSGLGDRREQLEVLAEAEILDARARRERDALELDHAAHA